MADEEAWSRPEGWPAAEPAPAYRAGGPGGSLRETSDRELLELLVGRFRRRHAAGEPWPETLTEVAACDEAELAQLLELSPRGGRAVAAVLELHRRLTAAKRPRRPRLDTPEAVNRFMRPMALLDHERLVCLPLNARGRLIGPPRVVSVGDVDGTDAGPRAFFRAALRVGAVSAVAVHNHPSGEAEPSSADRSVTRRLVAAGEVVDLALEDHVIIGADGSFHSLRRSEADLFRYLRRGGRHERCDERTGDRGDPVFRYDRSPVGHRPAPAAGPTGAAPPPADAAAGRHQTEPSAMRRNPR